MTLRVRWKTLGGVPCAIAYDDSKSIIVNELLDYSIYLSTESNLSELTIRNEIQHLCLFYNTCNQGKWNWYATSDRTISEFRTLDLNRLIAKSKSPERSLKRVVNSHLVRAYRFLYWLQKKNYISYLIGDENCQVRSDYSENNRSYHSPKKDYPLLFPNTGTGSKHSTGYCASDNDLELLTDYFLRKFSPYIAQRNILIMEIANQIGFRRGSINSLLCAQFPIAEIDSSLEDSYFVQPPKQKFNVGLTYKIPILLAYRINSFIHVFRKELLESKGFKERDTQGHIFLSETSGTPLHNQTISEIFGDAFRATGKRWGRNAIHSFRRKFTNDDIVDQTNSRLALGLDTSDASVCSAVSLKLGQSNPDSVYPYVSRKQIELIHNHRVAVRHETEALINENLALKMRIAELENRIKSKP